MSTPGCWGYILDGRERITHTPTDAYPDALGVDVLAHARMFATAGPTGEGELLDRVRALRMVGDETIPNGEDIARCHRYADPARADGPLDDWTVLLARADGDPDLTLEAGVMVAAAELLRTGASRCEYAYLIDLDGGALEAYVGGSRASVERAGRYRECEEPVMLVGRWSLDDLPDPEAFAEHVGRAEAVTA